MSESPSPGKSRSLLEQLPEIVRVGKRRAEQILEGLEGRGRIALQTRELVTPAKDTNWQTFQTLRAGGQASNISWINRLIYGDNLLAMAALLAGDEQTPSLRGKIDLFYIDPPFDSKADYRTKITLPGGDVEQKPTVVEQFAYSDTWADGTASYLAMIVPRLCLMRELLSDQGSIYVHLGPNVASWVEVVLQEIFGGTPNAAISWKRVTAHSDSHVGELFTMLFCGERRTKNSFGILNSSLTQKVTLRATTQTKQQMAGVTLLATFQVLIQDRI
jgi:adenine-specific DNA-methyltransferase